MRETLNAVLDRLRTRLKCGGEGSNKPGPCPEGEEGKRPQQAPGGGGKRPGGNAKPPAGKPSGYAVAQRLAAGLARLPECSRRAAEQATTALFSRASAKYGEEAARSTASAALAGVARIGTVGELLAVAGLAGLVSGFGQDVQADAQSAGRGTRFFTLLATKLDAPSVCPGDRQQLEAAIASLAQKSVRRRFAKLQRLLRRRFLKSRDASGHEHKPGGRPDGGQFTGSGEGGGGASKPEKPNRKPKPDADSATGPAAAPAKPPERSGTKPGWPEKPAAGGQGDAAPAPRKQREFKDRADAKKSLRSSETASNSPLKGGQTSDARLLQTADGTLAVFKSGAKEGFVYPGQEEKGLQDVRKGIRRGTFYQREVAASRVAEALGFDDLVPATTFRTEGAERGSAQAYVPNVIPAVSLSNPYDGDEDLSRAATLDYILGNTDRHAMNWGLAEGKKIVMYDNGLLLPESVHPEDYSNGRMLPMWEASERKVAVPKVDAASWDRIQKALLGSGISKAAVDLAKHRFDAVVEAGKDGKPVGDLPEAFGGKGKTLAERFGVGQSEAASGTGSGASIILPAGTVKR